MNIFFQWLSGLLSLFLAVFPTSDAGVEATVSSATAGVRQFLLTASYVFPVNLFLVYIAIVITVETIIMTSHIAGWVLHNISLGFFKRL